MNFKCSVTGGKCIFDKLGYEFYHAAGDECEYYKASSRYRKNDILIIDDTCRFYGLARTERLKKETLRFWRD